LKPWRKRMWCIPPKENAEFVCAMENVLETYHRPYDARFPKVCMDETSKQLVKEARLPAAAGPGRPGLYDYEYERNGVANIFMFTEPLAGWRHAVVTDRRTKVDWAEQVRELVDVHYPDAEVVTLIMDNLNTHGPWSFYEAFEPAEARGLAERIECVYTPKHGSWLNIAEIELNVLSRQCLDGRIPGKDMLVREVAAWERERNGKQKGVDWQFTTADARIKLRRLYPQIQG
jgi:hypothetical protein